MVIDDFSTFQNKLTINDILKAKSISHLKDTFNDVIKLSVPPAKIIMGLHFGGTEFKNLEDTTNIFEVKNTDLAYSGFCHLLSNNMKLRWNRSFDVENSLAVSRFENSETGEIRVIVFDSSRSIANKISFAMQNNLSGIKIDVINTDDVEGSCELDQDTFDDFHPFHSAYLRNVTRIDSNFPLLRTINTVLVMYSPKLPKEQKSAYTSESNTLCIVIVVFISFIMIMISLVAIARKYYK